MTAQSAIAAKDIYQELLDLIWDAMETQRYDDYQTYFMLPHTIVTSEGTKVLNADADLRKFFDTMCANLSMKGNSQMMRRCIAAEFKDAQTIHGSHETRVVGYAAQIWGYYPALSVLRLTKGRWRVASAQYATRPKDIVEQTLQKI